MTKHCFKTLFLLLPNVSAIVLLILCLVSDHWVTINPSQLQRIKAMYNSEHSLFLQGKSVSRLQTSKDLGHLNQTSLITSNSSIQFANYTLTNQSVDKTTVKHADEEYATSYEDSTYDEEENREDYDNTIKIKRRSNSYEYDYDSADSQTEEADEDLLDDHGIKKKTTTSTSTSTSSSKADEKIALGNFARKATNAAKWKSNEFLYIKKMWPFVKLKSPFYECVQYEPLELKISLDFLSEPSKEPILASISYGSYVNKSTFSSQCDGKVGFIRCALTNECVQGRTCDGVVDCDDQSDEQECDLCRSNTGGFKCDNMCWQFWHKCDQVPNCFDYSDEFSADCSNTTLTKLPMYSLKALTSIYMQMLNAKPHYDPINKCFRTYFDFKSSQSIRKESLKYLPQSQAESIQANNNFNYHLQLIYSLAFSSSLLFNLLSLFSLIFLLCFGKYCFQCSFWFYGFFEIIAWLLATFGLLTFYLQWNSNLHKSFDPSARLPFDSEIYKLNPELLTVNELGISFWFAASATLASFLASLLSCIVCCSMPSSRHEDKEYQIMQLPHYS